MYIYLSVYLHIKRNKEMKTTYNTIGEIELAIASSTNPYKIKDLKEKLSWMKAADKGQFITREHLIELRPLIIHIANKSLYFKGLGDNLKELMTELLNTKMVYRTEKGIKGIVCDNVKLIAKSINTNYVAKIEGEEVWSNSGLRAEGTLYYKVQQFNLQMLMA